MNIPREVSITAVNDSVCFTKDHDIARISTLRTFCAGGDNYGPCHGDSGKFLKSPNIFDEFAYCSLIQGGGFYVATGSGWTVKGIVSASAVKDNFDCDVQRFTIFTQVFRFKNWIKSIEGRFFVHQLK